MISFLIKKNGIKIYIFFSRFSCVFRLPKFLFHTKPIWYLIHIVLIILSLNKLFFGDFPSYLQSVYIHSNTISKLCVEKRGRVEECSVAPLQFDSLRYQIFCEAVGLKRDALNLVSTSEELLGRKSSCSGLEIREYDRGNPWRWLRGILYWQNLALTALTSGGRSVGIVRSRPQATESV
jgi:hypothetical protein